MAQPVSISFYSTISGNGSTTLAANLAACLAEISPADIYLLDGDIRFPTLRYYFSPEAGTSGIHPITMDFPHIDKSRCILCRACAKACVFDVIRVEKNVGFIRLEDQYCRACGACLNICRYGAVTTKSKEVGHFFYHRLSSNLHLLEAKSGIPAHFQVAALQAMKRFVPENALLITDAKSGFNPQALESIHHSQILMLMADATSFSKEYCHQVLHHLQQKNTTSWIIANNCIGIPENIRQFAADTGIEVVLELPYHDTIHNCSTGGDLFIFAAESYRHLMNQLAKRIVNHIFQP